MHDTQMADILNSILDFMRNLHEASNQIRTEIQELNRDLTWRLAKVENSVDDVKASIESGLNSPLTDFEIKTFTWELEDLRRTILSTHTS